MISKLSDVITKFYHDLSISELRLQNSLGEHSKLTYNDMLYLDIIRAYPGRYTSTQIADLLCVSRPSVTKKVKELIKKGYVTRRQSPVDKRVYYLFADENKCLSFYGDYFEKKLEENLCGKYSDKDLSVLCETLALIGKIMIEENND